MTDKQQKANIVCCETCSHREVCYEVITNTDYDFKGYGCLRYCVSPLVIRNNARKETAKEIFTKLIEVAKNNDNKLSIGLLKAWAIEYGVEVE